jgi:hypothetical protein
VGRSVEIYLDPDYGTGTEFGYRTYRNLPLEGATNVGESGGIKRSDSFIL